MPKITSVNPPERDVDDGIDVLNVLCTLEGDEELVGHSFYVCEGETWEDVERQANAFHDKLLQAKEEGTHVNEDVINYWAEEVCA